MKYQRLKLQHSDGRITFWCGPVQIAGDDAFEIGGGAAQPPIELPASIKIDDKARITMTTPDDAAAAKGRPTSRVKT